MLAPCILDGARDDAMTERRLFKVAEIAALIHKATGQHEIEVGQAISYAGQFAGLLPYDHHGKRMAHWPIGMVATTSDGPGQPLRISNDAGPSRYFSVDIYEVLAALKYHPETQAKVLAERDKPGQAGGNGNLQSATRHKLQSRVHFLDAEIQAAKKRALDDADANNVWAELIKMAEKQEGLLIGQSSEGLQYKGKKHQDTGEPDVFTLKALRDRLRRAKAR